MTARLALETALDRLAEDPKSLTDVDISEISSADKKLGDTALFKRAIAVAGLKEGSRPHHVSEYFAACKRASSSPIGTLKDLFIISLFNEPQAVRLYNRRFPPAPAQLSAATQPVSSSPRVARKFVDDDASVDLIQKWINKNFDRLPTTAVVVLLVKRMLDPLRQFTRDMNSKNIERNARLDALEARIAAVENQPAGLEYQGVFESGKSYRKGDVVSHGGSMWVAKAATSVRPGAGDPTSIASWVLAVKGTR